MPVALDESKKTTALALYMQELKWSAISEQSGVAVATLRKWADRGGWRAIRDTAKQGLQQKGEKGMALAVVSDLTKQGQKLRERLANELHGQADVLEAKPARTLKELRQGRSHVVKTLAEAGSKVFGWDQEQNRDRAVDLTILHAVRVELVAAPVPARDESPAIDVSEVPPEPAGLSASQPA